MAKQGLIWEGTLTVIWEGKQNREKPSKLTVFWVFKILLAAQLLLILT